jgi:hypothetical protein
VGDVSPDIILDILDADLCTYSEDLLFCLSLLLVATVHIAHARHPGLFRFLSDHIRLVPLFLDLFARVILRLVITI